MQKQVGLVYGQDSSIWSCSNLAMVRFGPINSDQYPERVSKTDLFWTAEFYKTRNPRQIFAERETILTVFYVAF